MSAEAAVDISVVIVTFNNENEIAPCLDSLLKELDGRSFQILIVDNFSKDRTRENIRKFWNTAGREKEELELICNQSNLGFTKALNQGLRKCHGQIILILNPDTKVQPSCLSALQTVLGEKESIGVVAPQLLNADGSIQSSCRRFPERRDVLYAMLGLGYLFRHSGVFNRWKMGDFKHEHRMRVQQPQGACLMFEKQMLRTVGFWDEQFFMFFSDVDWCRRVTERGYEIIFEPKAKVIHKQGASVFRNRPSMIWTSHLSFYKYFRKHYGNKNYFFINEILAGALILAALVRIALSIFFTKKVPLGRLMVNFEHPGLV